MTSTTTHTLGSEETKCVVQTNNGPVCGYIDQTDEGTYYKFKSVPYAEPPLGRLRFSPPVPIKPWTEVLDCTKDAPMPLNYYIQKQIIGSEDCLYIEISTPSIKPDRPLPVMFWIGSSGFSRYADNNYDPSLINNQCVLFARCGFRIGPFGFLSINDFMATGNSGLKDLVLALKWIQSNISAFGGDPNNITIFGNNTGGTAVHLLMLSPMASGLFHKAIIQSASALNNWCIAKNPSRPVMELAKELGITTKIMIDVIEELRATPALHIMRAFRKLEERVIEKNEYDTFDSIFKPCIEEEFEGQPAFLTKSPPIIIKSGNFNKVPIIIGSNNIEGSVLQFIKDNFYSDFEKYNENLSLIVPKSLAGEAKIAKSIGQQLLKFYLGGDEFLTKNTRKQYLQLISDYYFLYYVNKTVRLHSHFAPECPIYYYILNCEGEWGMSEDLQFSETPFIFRIKKPDFPAFKGSRDSVKTRDRVVKMWTNFAKYGSPTPDDGDPLLQITWDPVENEDKLNYLSIGAELTKGRNPFHERMVFWEELHKEHKYLRALVYFNDLGVSW